MTFPILGNGNYVSWRVISQLASYGKTVKCLLFHIAINKTTSHLRRDSTTQQTVNFLYLMQRLSEAHLCYEKKSQTGLDSASSAHAFQLDKEIWAPWWARFMDADLPSRTCEKHHKADCFVHRERPFTCQRGLNCGTGGIETHRPYVAPHCYPFHMAIFTCLLCCTKIKAEEIHLSWFYDIF